MLARLCVALLCLAGLAVPAHAKKAVTPSLDVLFSRPSVSGVADPALQIELIELIGRAVPGSTLDMATYVLHDVAVRDAVLAAHARGVVVRVVAEGSEPNQAYLDDLAAVLPPGNVVRCANGCNGPVTAQDVSHHKFFVFGELDDGRRDVVVQSSQNLDRSFGLNQNMLISSGDAALADGYRQVFESLAGQVVTAYQAPFTSGDGRVTAWMQPRDTAYDEQAYGSPDLIAAMIEDVACPGSIRIVHSQFATDRPLVIDALVAKRQAGCTVQVMVPEGNQTVPVAQRLAAHGIVVHTFRPGGCHDPAGGSCANGGVHSKILLVDGPSKAAGGAVRRYVYTGSHNLNKGSLIASDDSVVRVDDPAIYAAYDADYRRMMDEMVKIVPSAYPAAALQMAANGPQDQRAPRAAVTRNGYTAVTWTEGGNAVYARIYRDGSPVTGPVKVDMGGVGCATGYHHADGAVGVDDAGNAYVAWAEDGDCRGEHNIAVRRLSPGGTLSATVWANAGQWTGDQVRPRIAVRGTGAFTVVWEDGGAVRASGYSSLTTRVFGPLQLGSGVKPDVAVDGSGTATVVWQEGTHSVYGLRLAAGGTVTKARTRIHENAATQHLAPAVATTPAGDSVVVWSDNDGGVWRVRMRGLTASFGERFTEQPVFYGRFALGQPSDQAQEYPPLCHNAGCAVQGVPSVAADATGRFVVGWNETDLWNSARSLEVYARGFNPDATTAGRLPVVRLNPTTLGSQRDTALTAGPAGFTLFYSDDFDANNYLDIVARTGFTNDGF
ncbi:phosphatidylserine/phosphatidylglycerophosphate/cardiolipin synthase family protein [Nonomuraea sp. NPDC050663]|uniref:phosphatidylserine/phosphatidylglycerophosphate/ cardiolipin synthase family protein n=1 Tax=Nonomuraea sp. NPDC050663 TaxID=3364370 RepID=UPI0037B4177F